MDMIGRILLGLIGGGLACAFPLTEFARGMASSDTSRPSRKAAAVSFVGVGIAATAVFA